MAELTLCFFPGTCSRVSLIALCETGTKFDTRIVNFFKGEHKSPAYRALNSRGKVPTLLIDGKPLTETIAILHYLHDHFPAAKILPYNGDRKHDTHALSDLAWLNSTVQPLLTRLRVPMAITSNPAGFRDVALAGADAIREQFGLFEQRLATQPYLGGNEFSAIDAIAEWVFGEATAAGLTTEEFPKLRDLIDRVHARAAVQAALAIEGAAFGQLAAEGPLPAPLPRFI